jgi:hypothetical protein
MSGRALLMPTSASDYAHVIAACLFHDIGYVRGVLNRDGADEYVIDSRGGKTAFARGSSDAALLSIVRDADLVNRWIDRPGTTPMAYGRRHQAFTDVDLDTQCGIGGPGAAGAATSKSNVLLPVTGPLHIIRIA